MDTFPVGQAPWETGAGAGGPQSFPVGQAPWETNPQPPAPGATVQPWAPAAPGDSPVTSGLKTLGNFIPSLINTGVGLVKQPIEGIKNITKIPGEVGGLISDAGGIVPAFGRLEQGVYENLVPGAARDVVNAVANGTGASSLMPSGIREAVAPKTTDQALQSAQATMTNDPVGQILPFLLLGRETAYKVSPEAGAAFDSTISKVSKLGTVPAGIAGDTIGTAAGYAGDIGKFMAGQAMGLFPKTIDKIIASPDAFSEEARSSVSRESIAREVAAQLSDRIKALAETGKEYQPIRELKTPAGTSHQVPVDPGALSDMIKATTGLDVVDGKLTGTADSSIRSPSDISTLQRKIVDVYQPAFDRGFLTPNEYLNLRSDLGDMAKYEGGVGKSKPLENLADIMRGKFNTAYRGKIPGLKELDTKFIPQITELKMLKKGILDKDNKLTDTAINRIANATGKGKDLFLARLEQTLPGVTHKIQVLKAIEDIENAAGQKVGTYARSLGTAGILGGIALGNIPVIAAAIAEMIFASPEVAVPLLRLYGYNKALVGGIIKHLTDMLHGVNTITSGMGPLQSTLSPMQKAADAYFEKNPPSLGLSIRDVTRDNKGDMILYHGTGAPAFEHFKGITYLTTDPKEASGFAQGVHLGGSTGGETRVMEIRAPLKKIKNIDTEIETGMFDDGKTDSEIIKEELPKAKAEGYDAVSFTHPSNYTDGDFTTFVPVDNAVLKIKGAKKVTPNVHAMLYDPKVPLGPGQTQMIPASEFESPELYRKYLDLRSNVPKEALPTYDEYFRKSNVYTRSIGQKIGPYDISGADMVGKNPDLLQTKTPASLIPVEKLFKNDSGSSETRTTLFRGQESTQDANKIREGTTPEYTGTAFSRHREQAQKYGDQIQTKSISESQILKPKDVPPAVLKSLRSDFRNLPVDDADTIPVERLITKVMDVARQYNKEGADIAAFFPSMAEEGEVRLLNTTPEYRYHTTSPKYLASIAEYGLKPSRGQYGKGVYFAPTMEETGGYGSSEGAMIRIKKSDLPSDYDEFPEQGWTTQVVPPDKLEVSTNGGKTWKSVAEKKSLIPKKR